MSDKFNPRDVAQLDDLLWLANEAAAGKWEVNNERFFPIVLSGNDIVCRLYANDRKNIEIDNANFIAASREAVPALIEEIMRLREALELAHGHMKVHIPDYQEGQNVFKDVTNALMPEAYDREALKAEGV